MHSTAVAPTAGCEKDVKKMKTLLLRKELAYSENNIQTLLTEDATHDSVLSALDYWRFHEP